MCIFLIVEILLFLLFFTYRRKNRNSYFFLSALLLLMITGLHNGRFQPEIDFYRYMQTFLDKYGGYGKIDVKGDYDLEPAYAYFVRFLRLFGKTEITYIMGTAICFGIPFLTLVKKYSNVPPMSILLLFVILDTSAFRFYIAGHRQMVATIFFELAFLIYYGKPFKYKNILLAICLVIPLFAHSSSYIVLPMAIGLLFFSLNNKRTLLILLLISLILGLTITNVLSGLTDSLMAYLSTFEQLDRTTTYSVNDIYDDLKPSLTKLLPLTSFTAAVIYYSNEEECKSYPVKALFFATILKNLLGFLPLINRGIIFFIFLGIAGAIPESINKNINCKYVFSLILAGLIFIAYWLYSGPLYGLLPYKFIFE